MHRSRRLIALALLVATGCGGSSGSGGSPVTPNAALRAVGVRTAGAEGDALAAAVLLGLDAAAGKPGRATFAKLDASLRDRLIAMSATHVHANAFTTAAGAGQMGSAYVRRLAADPGAPVDRSGNGTNLDEVLAAHYEELAVRAGGSLPAVLRPVLFPWRDGSAEFATRADPEAPSQKTRPGQVGRVDMAQVGHAMLARVLLASAMLRADRDPNIETIPDRAVLGLLLLQQVLAMEETLFSNLFMDGSVLSALRFPTDYRPVEGNRWLPRAIDVTEDANVPGLVSSYAVDQRSSDLAALASLMRAGAELSYLASDASPDQALQDALNGLPFGRLPDVEGEEPGGNDSKIVTWEDGPSKIILTNCAVCHDSRFKPEPGLFAADSYDNVHLGGRNSRPGSNTPIITRGDPSKSVLYYILLANPPAPFLRMPDGGPPWLDQTDIDVIKTWIEDGARSSPPGPPRVGIDLAVTMFKNLVAMHLGSNGELFERHDGDSPVLFTTPIVTGAALQALASLSHLEEEISEWKSVLTKAAEFAADNLTNATGEVVRSFDLADGIASGSADLYGHASLPAGLFAAARALDSAPLTRRAEALGARLVSVYFDAGRATFRSEVGVTGARYSPVVIAAVVDALREMGAGSQFESFLKRLLPVMVFSELEGGGEILGDGVPDTDSNGIPEPVLAGGPFGRAPVFAGEIRDGSDPPPVDTPVTWSRHIQPLFRQKCGSCHMDGSTRGDGYLLDTRALAGKSINPNNPMPLIVPGDPENSFLFRKLVDRAPSFGAQMPLQTPPLAERGKEMVRRWILEGATGR